MKKILSRKIACFVFIMFMMIVVSSCRFGSDPYGAVESGDFVYATKGVHGEKDDIAIIGLSEQGKKKEVLVFPNMIDGHRVVQFGSTFVLKSSGGIIIENAKKVYFCNLFIDYDFVKAWFEYDDDIVDVFIGGSGVNQHKDFGEFMCENATNFVDEYL